MVKFPDDVMQSIEAVAKLNNDLYKWTSRMSYNGSWVGEPEGFIKGHIREMEKILDSLRDEVQRLNATAQPVSDGWVKCSECMPELGKPVLVVGVVGNTVQNNVYEWDGVTWCDYHNDYGDVKKDAFTHWRPLPSAPGDQDD